MNYRRNHPCASRDGHANKVFATWAARVSRLGIDADVEAGKATGSANEKQEADHRTEVLQAIFDDGITGRYHLAHSPEVCKQTGRHSEGNDVRERVEFAPEGTGCIGEACDAAV